MTALENQHIKNLTWKLACSFVVGAFVFGLTVSGAVYAYMDKTDKRFLSIENRIIQGLLIDSLRRNQIDYKFERLNLEIKSVQATHLNNRR